MRKIFLLTLLALPLLGLTRKLSPSVFLPLVASTLWFTTGALPLSLVVELDTLDRALSACQLAIAAAVLLRIRGLRGGEGWLLERDWFTPPLYSHGYFAAYGIVVTARLVAPVAIANPAPTSAACRKVSMLKRSAIPPNPAFRRRTRRRGLCQRPRFGPDR